MPFLHDQQERDYGRQVVYMTEGPDILISRRESVALRPGQIEPENFFVLRPRCAMHTYGRTVPCKDDYSDSPSLSLTYVFSSRSYQEEWHGPLLVQSAIIMPM